MNGDNPNENPSQHEVNKFLRVLAGERLKYTVRVHRLDGTIVEFQTYEWPKVKWNDDLRSRWLSDSGYDSRPMMEWPDGAILLVEDNEPKK